MIELVTVIVLLGLLAVVAYPRFSDTSALQQGAFADQVTAALRFAQKTAVSHRRLVCASFTASTVTLNIATANPAAACGAATLPGSAGGGAYARSPSPANVSVGVAPAGPIYFQPSGIVTNAAGVTTDFSVTVTGMPAISVVGATGHVQ